MNEYFQKIKEIAQKYINYAKANNLKKKILKGNIELEGVAGLSENLMNPAVISIALQDADVVEKLHDDKNLLYYVALLEEDDKLDFLNNHINIFEEDSNKVYEMVIKNIDVEKLLKTELGTRVIDAFPMEYYQKVKNLDNNRLQEINSQRDSEISLYDIANKVYQNEKGELAYEKKQAFLNENIDVKNKADVLKKEGLLVYAFDAINSTMSDTDKIKLIEDLDISLEVSDWINCNMSEELKAFIMNKTSDGMYKTFVNELFVYNQSVMPYPNVEKIIQSSAVLGRKKFEKYIDLSHQAAYSLITELDSNFDKDIIQALFVNGINADFLEMNFLEKYPTMRNMKFIIDKLYEINQENNGLEGFKKYYNFRKDSNGLDFHEGLYKSICEYNEFANLYNEIVENFQEFSDDEKSDFEDRWNELINLDNKFEIKNIQDFKNMNEIEKAYYAEVLESATSNLELKQAICEILVRDSSIYKITKLGNGTDYSMKNKSLEDVVDLISTINEMSDQKALKGILNDCIEMIGSEDLKRIRKIGSNIEEKIVQEYREGYVNAFTNYESMSDEELSKIDGIQVHRINGVRVIELMGADFAFLSHTGPIQGNHVRCCCSQITEENFDTFCNGLNDFTYIYSSFNSDRIKKMNFGDAGFSDYEDTYISSSDLASVSQYTCGGAYNEVTISTLEENGDDKLESTAVMTNRKVNSIEFNNILKIVSDNSSIPQTIYVLHEDIYNEKKKKDMLKKEEGLKNYFKSLDPKFLNLIFSSTGGDKQLTNELLQEIKDNIEEHMDNQVGKSDLRRNASRYWQLSRKKIDRRLPYSVMEELEKELSQIDNELLEKENIKDKVKEVADNYEYER